MKIDHDNCSMTHAAEPVTMSNTHSKSSLGWDPNIFFSRYTRSMQ